MLGSGLKCASAHTRLIQKAEQRLLTTQKNIRHSSHCGTCTNELSLTRVCEKECREQLKIQLLTQVLVTDGQVKRQPRPFLSVSISTSCF